MRDINYTGADLDGGVVDVVYLWMCVCVCVCVVASICSWNFMCRVR